MGISSSKPQHNDTSQLIDDSSQILVTSNAPNSIDINKDIPRDQYTCPKCKLIPEILKLDLENNEIEIICPKHGKIKLSIKDYLLSESSFTYYNVVCAKDKKLIQRYSPNNIFSYCTECGHVFCKKCSHDHKHNNLLPLNEINNKCLNHLDDEIKYCNKCQMNICSKTIHEHELIDIQKPNNEDIEKIKNKKKLLEKNKESLEYLIKTMDIILNTYEKHPNNYLHNINIVNIAKNLENKQTFSTKRTNDFMLTGSKNVKFNTLTSRLNDKSILNSINGLQKKRNINLEKRILEYFYNEFDIKLSGKETEIILKNKRISDRHLKLLSSVTFKNLEFLDLENNNISCARIINKFRTPKLLKLNLSFNKISDVSPLKGITEKIPTIEEIKLDSNKNITMEDLNNLKSEIGKDIIKCNFNEFEILYALDKNQFKNENTIRIFGYYFVRNNLHRCKISINDQKEEAIKEFYRYSEEEEILKIKIFIKQEITDMSEMFSYVTSLYSLPNFENWDTKNVTNMSSMFYYCYSMCSLPDISKWNTSKVSDMSYMFNKCERLQKLPDLSKWDTKNVTNMGGMFHGCSQLTSLPDISKWSTEKVDNMSCMFYDCTMLGNLPDIGNWNTTNLKDYDGMFGNCLKIVDQIPQKFK